MTNRVNRLLILAAIGLFIILACEDDEKPTDVDVQPGCDTVLVDVTMDSPTGSPRCINPGQSLDFQASGNCKTFSWRGFPGLIGGQALEVEDPGLVTFPDKGNYLIVLGCDVDGCSKGISFRVLVRDNCTPFTVRIDEPMPDTVYVDPGASVTFAASAAGGDQPYKFSWSFGGTIPNSTLEDPGPVTFNDVGTYDVILRAEDAIGDRRYLSKVVVVRPPGQTLPDGLVPATVNAPDAIQLLQNLTWAGVGVPYLLLAAGADGVVGLDPASGAELVSNFVAANALRIGLVAMGGAPLPLAATEDTETVAHVQDALFQFGDANTITAYDATAGEWEAFSLSIESFNTVWDGVAYNNDMSSGGFTATASGRITFVDYNATLDTWEPGKEVLSNSFPGATGGLITSFARAATGVFLAVTDGIPGALFKHDGTNGTLIGTVGDSPRKLRVLGDLCVITNFGSDSITIATWDASDNVTIVGTIPVGDGPVGVDLITLDDGNIGIVTTGFNDATVSFTVVTPAGALVSNTSTAVTNGCLTPGHAVWLRDGSYKVLISCNGTDNFTVMSSGL